MVDGGNLIPSKAHSLVFKSVSQTQKEQRTTVFDAEFLEGVHLYLNEKE